ncbi:oocyst capsule protein, putative [Plasmodium knowlesi strain H]|uniref:Oocyst capsule protein, putative n=2 Tax=Plasmodium knowlesi (strain H) TaxID=5851 RepID=A0A1A7W344_PLAKH|nr:oocyst capsule protein Cap380, putative [Plasmodium knowlesi strain H]CAA9987851.1 oocyst capsule protein Cap380, putative [Plasmodium knowlesi strain H]SBO22320.1 oocyst capsule protein, putative [Plasmodium knowlesi strain H]SBO28784.1 oocyst capsule protein, putative [Plasmodium knowlesi strain H]VVS77325.1 oocyst capsule protein Cap380, putative [Plasmodium knowlesi strain H]
MNIKNLYNVLVVCLLGIVCSSWFNESAVSVSAASLGVNNNDINYEDDYYNVVQKDLTPSYSFSLSPADGGAIRKRRYILDVRSFGKTCLLEYENICETADYSIHVMNGISGHVIKATLIQKESSDLVSVHNLVDTFSKDGSVQFNFKGIPSLHYSVVLEMSDLINNADYDIGKNCHCLGCSDNTRVIDLSEMENRITHSVRSDKKNKITFPQKSFVHGNFLFSKFVYFHSELNTKSIENYTQLYSFYNELVYPCSGTIMTHSMNYNIHYDLSSVHCYHVHMVDKFIKKIESTTAGDERASGNSTMNFMSSSNSHPILIKLEDRLSSDKMVQIGRMNYTIQLPFKYKDGGNYSPRGSVVGRLVTIYTHHVLFQKKYVYKNNVNNRMEYVHMFRILFNLFKELYDVPYEDMLFYTTGLSMRKEGNISSSSSHVDQDYNIYAEELSVLLNSLAFEFSVEAVGLNREIIVKEESQFVSEYGSDHFAKMKANQLVLRSSSEICLVVLESIARELSKFINLRLKQEYRQTCSTMRQGHSYANISPMYHTYELDCNLSVLYLEYNLTEDVMVKRLITNKTLFEEVKLELFYNNIFGYTVYLHVQVDDKFVRSLTKRVPKYVNGSTVVTMTVLGRRIDAVDTSDVMVILKEISFPIHCRENCTSKHPIVVEDNFDYITVGDICLENNGLPKVCFPAYSFGYVFDTRLLRVHMLSINPYPEILLTPSVQVSIVESSFCILTPTLGEIVPSVSIPHVYQDTVCKEYINRCSLLTTKFVLNDAGSRPGSAVAALRKNQFGVHLSTHFDEKHEEMIQVVYNLSGSVEESGGEQSFILTHYNDSFYINGRSNKMQWTRAKESFSKSGFLGERALTDNSSDDDDEDDDAYYKGVSHIDTKTHRVHVVENKKVALTHMQTPKQNDATLYPPFGEISINYGKIRPNVYMKFLNSYMYFYDGAEIYNEADTSPHFVNVSPYQYECLGAYAYLMNKFNILVNDSLNCDAIQMIIEVLLKANLGKYFIHQKNKKIHLNFFKKDYDSHDVFDLVHMEIYEAHAPLKPVKTYKLNVSIDENNLNLLHKHRNVEYPNKYFSNVYILMFKAAYLSNGYNFYTFFHDLTGIRLIDSSVVEQMDTMIPTEIEAVKTIQSILKDKLQVSVERHTTRYDSLINEISLLAAYVTELTSSYRKVTQRDHNLVEERRRKEEDKKSRRVSEEEPLVGIKYFVYVDEFKFKSEKEITAQEMAYYLAKHGVLMIKKKSLCCSNFVDEVENSLYYHIIYRYIGESLKIVDGMEDHKILQMVENSSSFPGGIGAMGHSIVQKLLGRDVGISVEKGIWSEGDVEYMANWIMGESGYIWRKDPEARPSIHVNFLDCINMDLQNHDENLITEFSSEFDKHGALVSIMMKKWEEFAGAAEAPCSEVDTTTSHRARGDKYAVYFLFRNLSVPFVGETHRTETLGMRRVLLLKGGDPQTVTNESVLFKVYIDNVDSNSIFMLEKVIFVSKEGDKVVREMNVEYQTFFVHPYSMILNTEIRNTHLGVDEIYYGKRLECHHYHNGLQVCNNPQFDYEGFSPYYVSYLENNQRKDIFFMSNEEIANIINNAYLSVSKRFQLNMGGDMMVADIYRTVGIIVEEVAYSVGIQNLGEKSCGTLYLNRGQLHVPNDGKSLISNIFYDTNYCIDRGAVMREILKICDFEKKDLVKLFDNLYNNLLPYQLNKKFADSLTREEVLSLIYYFSSVPPQVNDLVRENSIFLEIDDMSSLREEGLSKTSGGEEQAFKALELIPSESYMDVLLISRSMLSPNGLHEESIIQFNVALYTELVKNFRHFREKSGKKVDREDEVTSAAKDQEKELTLQMKNYLQSNRTCSAIGSSLVRPEFSNAGPLFMPDEGLTYNSPSFTYTDRDIYVRKQPDIHSSFNNLFLYEGQSTADGKYLSAIVVLSPHKFSSLEKVTYIGLLANTFDDTKQFELKCYPHVKYDTTNFSTQFNLEPNTVYLVCRNMPVKFLRNGLYEFNKYLVHYDTHSNGTVDRQIYGNMPIRPVYEVSNDPKTVIPKAEDIRIKVNLVQNISTSVTNESIVEYQIEVSGLVDLHTDPYSVVKPVFTHSSYLYNTIIYTIDDFMTYTYPRNLKHWEFSKVPFSKNLFKDNAVTLRKVQCNTEKGVEKSSKTHCVYSLVMVKSCTLMKVIIRDLYGNEYEVNLDEEDQSLGSEMETKPAKEVAEPTKEETKPAKEESKPAKEETKPAKEESKPANEETTQNSEQPCTPFVLTIRRRSSVAQGNDDATSIGDSFFLVYSPYMMTEGFVSLTIGEDMETYSTDLEDNNLMSAEAFAEIYKIINRKMKLLKGDYWVRISKSTQGGKMADKDILVQRVNEDGSAYNQRDVSNFWKKGFNVDLFGKRRQDKLELYQEEKLEQEKSDQERREELVQVQYERRIDYLINIRRTDTLTDGKKEAYEHKYTLFTGTLNSSVTSVVVKDGKLSATCLEGDCILENTFIEEMLNAKNLKNGTYELDIKKRIQLTRSQENDRQDVPLSSSSSSSLRGGSARNGRTLVCIVENSFNTLSGGMKFRKVVHVGGKELSAKEGTYDVFITKGKYLVTKGSNIATVEESEVVKKCISKAWKIKGKTDYKFAVQLSTIAAGNVDKLGDEHPALIGDDEKEYYLMVNKLGQANMPLYEKNRITHFVGRKGLVSGKYIVHVNGEKYVTNAVKLISDSAQRTVEDTTTPLEKATDGDEYFFQDLFKMLHKKPSSGSYYVEISNSQIEDMISGLVYTDKILLAEAAATTTTTTTTTTTSTGDMKDGQEEEVDDDGDNNVKAYLVEVVSHTEDDEGFAEYEEIYILHGYTLKSGQYNIEYKDGVCTLKSILNGNVNARSSDMENVLKISNRKMNNNDGYFVFIREISLDAQGDYIDKLYGSLWKDNGKSARGYLGGVFGGEGITEDGRKQNGKGALFNDDFWNHVMKNVHMREHSTGSGIIPSVSAHEQKGSKEEGDRPFLAYVYLDNDGEGNSCTFRKVLQGWGTGLEKGKYQVKVLNGSYIPTTIHGPSVNIEYLKMLIQNAWAYPDRRMTDFHVDIHPGNYLKAEQGMESTLDEGEAYYSVSIKQLNDDELNGMHSTGQGKKAEEELIKMAGKNVPTGEYIIEMTDEKGTVTGMDANGKKMDVPFLKNVITFLYDRIKRGKYHVVITKDVNPMKIEQDAAVEKEVQNKTFLLTEVNHVDELEIVEKMETKIMKIKVHPDSKIQDGSYGIWVYEDGTMNIRGIYMGSSFGPSEEEELKRVLLSSPEFSGLSSGLYLLQVKSSVKKVVVEPRSNFREDRDTSSRRDSSLSDFPACMNSPRGKKTSMTLMNQDGSVVYYDNQPDASGRIPLPSVKGGRKITQYQRGNCQDNIKIRHCTSSDPSNCMNLFKARRIGDMA